MFILHSLKLSKKIILWRLSSLVVAFSLFIEFGALPLELEGSMRSLVEPYLSVMYSDYDN